MQKKTLYQTIQKKKKKKQYNEITLDPSRQCSIFPYKLRSYNYRLHTSIIVVLLLPNTTTSVPKRIRKEKSLPFLSPKQRKKEANSKIEFALVFTPFSLSNPSVVSFPLWSSI